MKKILTLLTFLSVFIIPSALTASTVSFAPSSVSVIPGQSFSMTLSVDPQASSVYTAKVALSFPPNLLSVTSFSHASGWMPLNQPGYDAIDNSSGVLIKTAGIAGGIWAPRAFGTVTFTAIAAGTANISVTGATQLLDASNQNTFTGGGQSMVSISAPVIIPAAPAQTPAKPKTSPARNILETPQTVAAPVITAIVETSAATTSENEDLMAQAVQTSGKKNIPLNIIIPVATFLIGFLLGRNSRAL